MAVKDPNASPETKKPIQSLPKAAAKKPSSTAKTSTGANKTQKAKASFEQRAEQASEQAEVKIQAAAKKVEATLDQVAAKVTKKVQAKVNPELEQKARKMANQVDSVAGKVEEVVNEIGSFIPDPNKTHSHSGININGHFQENVSRLFIFRFLWLIIQIPVMYIWSIWILIINIIQWLHMLILGKRNQVLRGKTYRYLSHTTKRNAFISGFVDEQPKILEDKPE